MEMAVSSGEGLVFAVAAVGYSLHSRASHRLIDPRLSAPHDDANPSEIRCIGHQRHIWIVDPDLENSSSAHDGQSESCEGGHIGSVASYKIIFGMLRQTTSRPQSGTIRSNDFRDRTRFHLFIPHQDALP